MWLPGLINRMSEKPPEMLRAHALVWDEKDPFFFRKPKPLALSKRQAFEAKEVADIVLGFGRDDLWNSNVRRESLFLLADRRAGFSHKQRASLVDPLLSGPVRLERLPGDEWRGFRDEWVARYVKWLESQGFPLTGKQSRRLSALIDSIVGRTDERVSGVVVLQGPRVGWLRTDDFAENPGERSSGPDRGTSRR